MNSLSNGNNYLRDKEDNGTYEENGESFKYFCITMRCFYFLEDIYQQIITKINGLEYDLTTHTIFFHGSTGKNANQLISDPGIDRDVNCSFGPLFYTFEGVETGIYRALSIALDKASFSFPMDNPIITWYLVPNTEIKFSLDVDNQGTL